jgi:biopolymer transport protein ExbB
MTDLVNYYVNGGSFMHPILVLFIVGIGFGLYKLYFLLQSTVDTKDFILRVRQSLEDGGAEAALQVCMDTKGPVASIFAAGISRIDKGVDAAEKAITNAGSVEMAFLEKGMIVMSSIITLAPMLGFTGTVGGMIKAFDDIKAANDISPAVVAGGISQALLTTVFGLIVAMIVQVFYNFFTARIDRLIVDMEEASLVLVDELVEHEHRNK